MDATLDTITLDTNSGPLTGSKSDTAQAFLGIPYAAPPVGARRFRAPEAHPGWSEPLDCTGWRASAPQNPPLTMMAGLNVGPTDEDCLHLNIWTPRADDEKRPVMVWIHGGAFYQGSGSQALYRAGRMAHHGDVVVVTINYRLGALGFLALGHHTDGAIPASGTEGLLDQIAALRWVRDNIAAFGGDPDNVTIFGESAGGASVGCLLAMPGAKGLFKRAIAQSGACHVGLDPELASRTARLFAEETAKLEISDMQTAPVEALLKAQANLLARAAQDRDIELAMLPFQPVIDGEHLPGFPIDRVRQGSADDIDVIVGTTLDEWTFFGGIDPKIAALSEDQLERRVARALPDQDPRGLIDAFRAGLQDRGGEPTPGDILIALQTDRIFRVPAQRLLEALEARGNRGRGYVFTWPSPAFEGRLGACHAIEIGFIFGTYALPNADQFFGGGPDADALSAAIMEGWVNFARSGAPSGGACPDWERYDRDRRVMMEFGAPVRARLDPYIRERMIFEGVSDAELGMVR